MMRIPSKHRWLWVLAAVLALAIGIFTYLKTSQAPLGEVAELVAEGGEKMLREPMRPARGGPRVLVLAFDGVGDDELRRAIREGGAPNLATLVGAEVEETGLYEHAYMADDVLSILPSTTLAAWSSLFSGEPAAMTGIPGNEWFVREEMAFYAPAPVSVTGSGDAVRVYTENLIGDALRVPTLYERADLRSYVSLSHVYRGADVLTMPDLTAFGDLVSAVAEGVASEDDISQETYAELDQTAVESLIESLGEYGVADLQVVYFPGVDLYTHVAEAPIEDQRRYLKEVIDHLVGLILEEYRVQNALDSTYVVMVADHGHTPVVDDDRHALEVGEDDEPTAVIEAAGFRLRPMKLSLAEDERDFQATVAYQGAFAYVYLADRSTCATEGQICDWRRPPRLEEDVLPVVRAFDAANRTGAGVPEMRGTLDLIFAREPRPYDQDALPFQVWDGERLVPIGDYLAANPRPDLLELEARLEGLAAGPYGHRAGDILLLTRTGADRPIEDRFYFSGKYRSWHGSPTAQDSHIPLMVARYGDDGDDIRARVQAATGEDPSQLDITPLILHLLNQR